MSTLYTNDKIISKKDMCDELGVGNSFANLNSNWIITRIV